METNGKTLRQYFLAWVLAFIAGIIIGLAISQWLYLRDVHSTFEKYYAFRGCVESLQRTNDYGICVTSAGQTIKIVKYQDKWYLDGDLPWACIGKVCFGI